MSAGADTRSVTEPGVWAAELQRRRPVAMEVVRGRVVVVAAHPDDETLGAAGYLRAVHAEGASVALVVATDGEAAFPEAGAGERAALAKARRAELTAALAALGLADTPVTWLGLPDSGLADREDALVEALREPLRDADLVLAPWVDDPHPDHAAAGRAANRAAPVRTHRFGYPIWMWPWLRPDDPVVPWPTAACFALDDAARTAKAAAIERFTTQLAPAPDDGPPILPREVLAHFAGDRELFFRVPAERSAPADRFAELYAADPDPWRTRDSWYERRKRAVVTACLPRERYRHVAEPGCGTGELTTLLVERADRVSSSDYTAAAVAATRAALGDACVAQAPLSDACATQAAVSVVHAALPEPAALPEGVDLVMLSEVLYYLAPDAIDAVTERVAEVLEPEGDLVLVHWRGWPAEAPQDAEATHARVLADPRFRLLVEHRDDGFLLHVLRRR